MLFYADEEISPRMGRSPEGFLICKDAVLARCGDQLYTAVEIPTIDADGDGWITVTREPKDVFAARSLASFTGKPITIEHPDSDVNGENYRRHAVGHVLRARRGEGADADVVLGDLFITDPEAAELVQDGVLRALSVGYNADYIPTGPGRARQVDIVVNHLALLPPGAARCGPRCVIGDSTRGRQTMRDQSSETHQAAFEGFKEGLKMPNQSLMGAKPFGSIPGSLVARLPGSRDSYVLKAAGPNETALLYSPQPGYSVRSTSSPPSAPSLWKDAAQFRQVARDRVAQEQRASRKMAADIKRFWEGRQHG
jgi:hypothetical protein